ncbi:hypothetical protein BU17DRAFT_69331 [Hysterangium stoloniferum]|nr:hypothetical protein BU17DRAFT_69331 [Hysterangium stoloniferum]
MSYSYEEIGTEAWSQSGNTANPEVEGWDMEGHGQDWRIYSRGLYGYSPGTPHSYIDSQNNALGIPQGDLDPYEAQDGVPQLTYPSGTGDNGEQHLQVTSTLHLPIQPHEQQDILYTQWHRVLPPQIPAHGQFSTFGVPVSLQTMEHDFMAPVTHSSHMEYTTAFNGIQEENNSHQVQSCDLMASSSWNNVPPTLNETNHHFQTVNIATNVDFRAAQNHPMPTDAWQPFYDHESPYDGYIPGERHTGHSHVTTNKREHSSIVNDYAPIAGTNYAHEGSFAVSPNVKHNIPDNSVVADFRPMENDTGNATGGKPESVFLPHPSRAPYSGFSPPFNTTSALPISSSDNPALVTSATVKMPKAKTVQIRAHLNLKIPRSYQFLANSKIRPLTPLYRNNADIVQYIKLASNSPACKLCGAYKTDANLIEHWKNENFNDLKVMNSQWKMDVLIAAAYLCPMPKCNSKSPNGVPAFLTQKAFYKHINYHITRTKAHPTPTHSPDVVLEEGKTDMMSLADTYFSDHPFWRPEEVAIFPDRDQKLVWLFHQ